MSRETKGDDPLDFGVRVFPELNLDGAPDTAGSVSLDVDLDAVRRCVSIMASDEGPDRSKTDSASAA